MANECKIEFYFKREEIEKLLKENPDAKGIIISQEIVREKPKGSLKEVNMVKIKARAVPAAEKKAALSAKSATLTEGAEAEPAEDVDGCPYPPGCN